MRFTNSTVLSTVMEKLVLLTGTRSETTFTSKLRTVKIASEHFDPQRPGEIFHVNHMILHIVPNGVGQLGLVYEMDRQGTVSQTVTLPANPFNYGLLGSGTGDTTFILADSTSDTTATDMVDDDDVYAMYQPLNVQGREFELEITISDESPIEIVGLTLAASVAGTQEAYLAGRAGSF